MAREEIGWRDIADPVNRRKLQNRQNQRYSRERKAKSNGNFGGLVIKQWRIKAGHLPKTGDCQVIKPSALADAYHGIPTPTASFNNNKISSEAAPPHAQSCPLGRSIQSMQVEDGLEFWYRRSPDITPTEANILRKHWYQQKQVTTVPNDRLITLIYYNVFRGFATIVDVLGLKSDRMCDEYLPSPFLPLSPTSTSALTNLPKALQPTYLQRTVDHHAYIDIYPCAKVRDNVIIQELSDELEEDLCTDIMGGGCDPDEQLTLDEGSRTGTSLWGDPCFVENWEISEHMARKWSWVFAGAYDLQDATNARRRRRGWNEIFFA